MRLATIRIDGYTRAARIDGADADGLDQPDVGTLLARADWPSVAATGEGPRIALSTVDYAPLVPRPAKIFCVGLNYRTHILEMGRPLPTAPTLFAKFPISLIGANDPLVLPAVSAETDWEVELGVVVGTRLRRATTAQAVDAIGGYTIVNDVTMRDWQWRTTQWLQGKTFEATTPLGPWLVTPDEVGAAGAEGPDLAVRCLVDDAVMQDSRTSDLLFSPAETLAYISQVVTLEPGDVVATGTPGGVGSARDPKVFLRPGQVLRTAVEGLGECVNACVTEEP
ncbi:fumarylacetoacetate hydrolase family protein [Virgisporangium ochraceum]